MNEVQIAPSEYDNNIFNIDSPNNDIINGLTCIPTGIITKQKQNYCNQLVHSMMNVSNISSAAWNCELYTDFSHTNLVDIVPAFRDTWTFFLLYAAISSIYSIIHDFNLVYYRDDLSKVISYPQGRNDIYVTEAILLYVDKYPVLKQLCCLCLCIPFLIPFILEVIWALCFRQFFLLFKSMRKCKLDQLDFSGFAYVSSAWVAISSGLIMFASGILTLAAGGFPYRVPSIDPDACWCTCTYLLYQSNLYGFFTAACVLIFINFRFLYNWYKESIHGEQYLYLISYSLPMHRANSINRSDPTGDMFGKSVGVTGAYGLMSSNYNIQDEISDDADVNTMTSVTRNCRFLWFICCYGWTFLFLAVLVMSFGVINMYGYPTWLAVLIFVFGILLCFCIYSIVLIVKDDD